ncbi:pyridine nucleotide-disulfide oxidoreductase [Stackebrandtia albiflava]|uniref:Pyridine nucleotide-disulfide oxidoreductase n=1 Tax=Stackebrandtia albiflava TaxID=406432 RepID=A0A562V9H0_9ACTN|nr:NAD(P)-binding domain-containing protein [Stackebrandtia albiflava]TWJ14502.1 pyridine nucleotide-disulfide oxidoreductase [Stackebrandtia albiflava]
MSETTTVSTAVVIGAGPVGLAAAAHLVERGITPVVLEAGDRAGAAVAEWSHVRLFSPWRFNIDAAARRLLSATGWTAPNPDHLPTGGELVADYLAPLAATPELADRVRYGATVVAVARAGVDKTRTVGRDGTRYLVRIRTSGGTVEDLRADAVIDASGTWGHSNPLGAHGLPALGESEAAPYLTGPLPDVLGAARARFAGRHTLVVGMGHSAANTLLTLAELAETAPGTRVTWAIRAASAARAYGGGDADALPARGALGTRLRELVTAGRVTLLAGLTIDALNPAGDTVTVSGHTADGATAVDVHNVVAATGFRPDLSILREVRLDLDPAVEAPTRLGPLVDPNFHSCGTVPPHGERELAHPDTGFYIAGMKSYGRAPTFLMATGYEQVRSIAAALAGDREAADAVHLELPETGVCSSQPVTEDEAGNVVFADSSESCCGGPAAAPAPPARGLATGVAHGHSGAVATLPVAQASGCCGGADPA